MNNIDFDIVGNLIKQLRLEKNMKQPDLAKVLGVTKAAVSQWESGSGIKTELLYKIAKYFDITVEELINGRLEKETNYDYWKRNYDLTNYDLHTLICNNNIELVKEFFEHCNMVINRFYKLLPLWTNDELNQDQIEEFDFIKKYFKFDDAYASFTKTNNPRMREIFFGDMEKEHMQNQFEKLKHLASDEFDWELSKCYDFAVDLKRDEIAKSKNMKFLEFLLTVENQPLKDALLTGNLSHEVQEESFNGFTTSTHTKTVDYTYDEIERISFFKVMLNGGCNCMLRHKNIYAKDSIDFDEFKMLEGNVILYEKQNNEKLEYLNRYMNAGGHESIHALKYWKYYSLKDYQEATDFEETKYLKSLVNNKNDNPIQYLKDMMIRFEK